MMSNWISSYHLHEEEKKSGTPDLIKISQVAECEQSKLNFNYNKNNSNLDTMQSQSEWNMHSNFDVWNHSKFDQLSVQCDNWQQNTEEYNISSSLKNIWNDTAGIGPTNSNQQNNFSQNMDRMNVVSSRIPLSESANNNVGSISSGIVKQNVNKSCYEWDNATMANNFNGNLVKRRPITSRNGIPQPTYGMENNMNCGFPMPIPLPNQTDPALMLRHAQESSERFMQRLQAIVNNGFLDPKILNEPISPETYELVKMLIYFVMEYSKTTNYVKSENPNAALHADINIISNKINLIQCEIAKCQSNYIEARRMQQEIWQSFMANNSVSAKQQTLNGQRNLPMTQDVNNRCNKFINEVESIQSNQCYNLLVAKDQSQRISQSQFDQLAKQQNASRNIQFSPKNWKNRLSLHEQTNNDMMRKNSERNSQLCRKESPI